MSELIQSFIKTEAVWALLRLGRKTSKAYFGFALAGSIREMHILQKPNNFKNMNAYGTK